MLFKPFSHEEQYLIQNGTMLTNELKEKISQALGIVKLDYETKRHCYITSTPGAGKTFTVKSLAKQHGIKLVNIEGVASISAITAKLASAVYLARSKPLTVWVDDCDSLFTEADSLNVMKGALDPERNVWSYQKNLVNQITSYMNSEDDNIKLIGEALQSFQVPGQIGVEVPMDNVRFIVTSNLQLTPSSMLRNPKKPFWKPPAKMMHEAAVRDRVNYLAFILDDDQNWGWLASVVMDNDVLDLDEAQKHILLDWMRSNWKRLPSASMRSVLQYAADMLNDPANYINKWNVTLL